MNRIIKAFTYSMSGLKAVWKSELAFRQEIILTVVLIPLALWLTSDNVERVLLIAPLFLALIVEVLNSAIEACIDRIGSEIHPLSKQAKDMSSAAVWLSLLLTVIIWLIVLI